MKMFRITRDITSKEQSWMPKGGVIKEGTVVYEYLGHAYGCISPGGIAVTYILNGPFFQVPHDAVEEIGCTMEGP